MSSRWVLALFVAAALAPACCPCGRALGSSKPAADDPSSTAEPRPSPAPTALSADRARARKFVEDVTLGAEFYGTDDTAKRWTRPIRASVVEGRSASLPDLGDVLSQLNSALAGTFMRVNLAADGDKSAELWIHVAPLARFDSIASANGFRYAPGNWGYAYTFWNDEKELTRAHVLLASDKLNGAQLRHFTFEEITHCLGPLRDSPVYPESVLYAAGANNGRATRLAPVDRELLRFLYAHVSPGADRQKLDALFDAYWR